MKYHFSQPVEACRVDSSGLIIENWLDSENVLWYRNDEGCLIVNDQFALQPGQWVVINGSRISFYTDSDFHERFCIS